MDRTLPRYFIYLTCLALLCALVRGWLMPLSASFYLDETGTVYLISGSWNDFLNRMAVTIQSPLYMAFLWMWSRIAGFSEVALRIPSVLAAILSTYLLYRLGTRIADQHTGIAAAVAHFSIGLFIQQTFQARPYSFAVLGAVLAISSLFDWFQRRSWGPALQAAFALAALLYIQPLNASMLAVAAVLIALYHWSQERIPLAQAAGILVLPVILLLPILPYYRKAAKDAAVYVYTSRPALDDFVNVYADLISPGAILLGFLAAAFFVRKFHFAPFDQHPFAARTCVVWVALPVLLIFLYSRMLWPVFILRYYSVAFPAVSLCLALLFRSVTPVSARAIALTIFSLTCTAAVWSTSLWPHTSEWRAGAEVLRQRGYAPDTPVLVGSGFIESKTLERLQDPGALRLILSPIHAYPVPGRIYAMPYNPGVGGGGFWKGVLAETVERHPRVMIYSADPAWHTWFVTHYGKARRVTRLHEFVTEVERTQGDAGVTQ